MDGARLPPPARFKYDPESARIINGLIQDLLDKQHIIPSKSPVAAACFLVKQKGKHRLVMDYRGINAITQDSAISMPTTEHFLAVAARAALISKMDLKSAFHQIRVHSDDQWKTAFSGPSGVYEFRVVPFGMKGSPATTVATINLALQGIDGAEAYVDDIMVYTNKTGDHQHHNLEECTAIIRNHAATLRKVLHRLREEGLFVKKEKGLFFADTLDFVGYEVRAGRGATISSERALA